jgi:arabinose-5-phosphate isomerase
MLTPQIRHLDLSSGQGLLSEMKRILADEAAAISACIDKIDPEEFADAVRQIVETTGRIVVTGMGKSGAIGRKFAGTLSSTGTPAHFLHPSEGLHGDLGVVSSGDVICAFSYSGETDELIAILPVLTALKTPIIAFTASKNSTLGKAASVVLNVEVEREACPMNLAPTTSTTVMLALSDALALVVMQAKEFTPDDYAMRHPAGALGRKLLLKVGDIMRKGDDVAIIPQSHTVLEAMSAITRARAGAAIVVDHDGKLSGLVTEGDWRRQLIADPSCLTKQVTVAMNSKPHSISPDLLASEALNLLKTFHPIPGQFVGDAPVVDSDNKPIGMLTFKDLIRSGIAKTL